MHADNEIKFATLQQPATAAAAKAAPTAREEVKGIKEEEADDDERDHRVVGPWCIHLHLWLEVTKLAISFGRSHASLAAAGGAIPDFKVQGLEDPMKSAADLAEQGGDDVARRRRRRHRRRRPPRRRARWWFVK